MFGRRILVLIPHPDDEVVMCGGALERARAEGAALFGLFVTQGCPPREALWPWQRGGYAPRVARRQAEAEAVAARLGLTAAWPWPTRPARSVRHDLAAIRADIAEVVARRTIDQIWVPAYEGGHADHDSLNGLAAWFMPALPVLEWAAYNFAGGQAQAQTFPAPNGTETVLTLAPEESRRKRELLELYRSERGNLDYVGMDRECFRPLAAYDYARPPHEGTLWYARFQWVPFRHPRVDFTRPEEISAALRALA